MKKRFKFIIVLIVGLILHLSSYSQTYIAGVVRDEIDSLPVPHVMLIAGKDTAITDSLGNFKLLVNNAKKVTLISENFAPQEVELSGENEYDLRIYLSDEADLYVKDAKHDNRSISNLNNTELPINDTSKFVKTQGRFSAYIYNKETKEPLESVYIKLVEMGEIGMTDSLGFIEFYFDGDTQTLTIDGLGYDALDTVVRSTPLDQPVKIYLHSMDQEVGGAVVYGRKTRYKNKNNPAVQLIRKVIDHKDANRMLSDKDLKFESYDKMVFYASNLPRFVYRNPIIKPFRFLFENQDTVLLEKRRLLPLYISETIGDNYYRQSDKKKIERLTAEKRLKFSEEFIESNNISVFLNRLYDNVDVYDNQVRILNNFFLSPLAPSAPAFYKFYIVDTTIKNGEKIVQLRFLPRNTHDFLFEGNIFVTLSPDYAVTKLNIALPKNTPVNLVNSLTINLGFEKQSNGKYWQNDSRYTVNFGFFNSKRGAVGVRQTNKRNLVFDPVVPDSLFDVQNRGLENKKDTAFQQPNSYWQENRPIELSHFEAKAYTNLDSAKAMPYYKRLIKIGAVASSGFYPYKNLEFGRIFDLVNFNPIEGFKPRIGGRTRIKNWQKFLVAGYVSYGIKDERFKYYIGGTLALNNKYIYGFPMHNISMNYQYDLFQPGQEMSFESQDRFLDLFRRGDVKRYFYNKQFSVSYNKELQNHMLFTLGYKNLQQEATGSLYFERANGSQDTINNLRTNEFSLDWRFSPGEVFFQNKNYRGYTDNGAWLITMTATAGFNNGYSPNTIAYQKLETRIDKRFFLAPFGNVKMIIRAGFMNGAVPYPYLFLPLANQTYRFSIESYNLMNYSEFAYDKYASLTLDYHLKGFLFNRIPLIRQLYLREVFGFKVLYGGIRNENLPQYNSSLLKFPADRDGNSIVHQFDSRPYIEASVGIENILKVIRIDFVKRFTYEELPLAAPWGIRFSMGLDF